MSGLKRVLFLSIAAIVAAGLPAFAGGTPPEARAGPSVEVIALLEGPPGPDAAKSQQALAERIADEIPGARVRWRYRLVLNGIAVVLPRDELGTLRRLPGVADVEAGVRYSPSRTASPGFIGAPALWGPALKTAGNGIKIGIVDDGLDRSHPYFSARGYRMPLGFPKGLRSYTSAKVIVARSFSPAFPRWRFARRPFDPLFSSHATHVAGIAAGNYRTRTGLGGRLSGVAPKAYLGNYKVLTVPTSGFGLNGNSPEIVAGIEAAVRDGMDVINLSLGEPEIEPSRDLVALALDGAAARGVVPVVAAGNDFEDHGNGSITSPGSSERAISVAAESMTGPLIASFSSGGPTPLSLRMKPDVSAPGVTIPSSVPKRDGLWSALSGTSMAAPHVAGAVALLRQRHKAWTVAQIKSALVQTGTPVRTFGAGEAPTTRQGGGSVSLTRADAPFLFAEPSGLSFAFVAPGTSAIRRVGLADAGGGAGTWTAAVEPQTPDTSVAVTVPPAVGVPGQLFVTVTAGPAAAQLDHMGFVSLTRGADRRRIPYWFRVSAPALPPPAQILTRTGMLRGDTRGRPARVESYRYPDDPRELGLPRFLRGPEQVFRVHLSRPATNLGVVVLARRGGVEPRIVRAGDENRLLGSIALPYVANPYLSSFSLPRPISGATRPAAGDYDVVFDSAAPPGGRFTFRLWIGDTTPPRLRVVRRVVRRGGRLRISVAEGGSGANPASLRVAIDGRRRAARLDLRRGVISVGLRGLARGGHRVTAQLADYQELKNTENTARILPNTGRLRTFVRVR